MTNAVNGMTERMLDDAPISAGMRVLDIGCGPGTVSLMLSRRVGDHGHVFAVDRDPQMLQVARAQARDAGFFNITFLEGGFDVVLPGHGTLDGAVGRRVLMYQPDAAQAVTQLARAIRPGGLIAFHEHDTIAVNDAPVRLPLHDQVRSWLREMLRKEKVNPHMGFDLHGALSAAGLEVECVRAEANVLTPTAEYPVASIIRAVLPRLLEHGIVTETDADIDTLDQRLLAERKQNNATCVWELVFCAWARKPVR